MVARWFAVGASFALLSALLSTLSLAACSLLVDASGLDDAPSRGADGGADAVADAAVVDGASGPSPSDAGGDVLVATRDACSSHTFCDTFDEAPLGALWSTSTFSGGGELALETNPSRSGANSLAVNVPTSSARAFLEKTLMVPGGATTVRAGFSIFPESYPGDGAALRLTAKSTTGVAADLLFIMVAPDSLLHVSEPLSDGSYMIEDLTAPTFPLNDWTTCVLTLSYPQDSAARVDLVCDHGELHGQLQLRKLPIGEVSLAVGYERLEGSAHLHFDDVWLDAP